MLNSDSIVSMNLNNGKRTDTDKGELVGVVVNLDENLIIDLELMTGTAMVCLKKAFVNKSLSVLSQSMNVGNQGNIEEHVTLKHKSTWRIKTKRGVRGTMMCIHHGSQSIVNQQFSFLGRRRREEVNEGTDNLTDTAVNGFNDAVGGWSVWRNENLGDASIVKI